MNFAFEELVNELKNNLKCEFSETEFRNFIYQIEPDEYDSSEEEMDMHTFVLGGIYGTSFSLFRQIGSELLIFDNGDTTRDCHQWKRKYNAKVNELL